VSRPPRIALVGFMGSGKSTVGRDLAARLGYAFVDSDEAIRDRTGRTPAEIFRADGEPAFRAIEAEVLSRLIRVERQVLATGGGAFIAAPIAEALLAGSRVVHLHCDFEEAYRRSVGAGGRPLLDAGKTAAWTLYQERKDKYSRAHVEIDTTHRQPAEVVDEVIRLLDETSRTQP